MMPVLRWYQTSGISDLRQEAARGKKRLLFVLPTGGGKTAAAIALMSACVSRGKTCLFVADKRDLVTQAARRIRESGLRVGIVMADCPKEHWDLIDKDAEIQVCSKQTLVARALRSNRMNLPPADLIVPDEAHRSVSKWWSRLLASYPDAFVVGLTATPVDAKGRGLGSYYQGMVSPVQPSVLLQENFLVPARCYAPTFPDLDGVQTGNNGDYVRSQLEERMNRANMVGDVVGWWKTLAEARPTILYAAGVDHSLHLCKQFRDAGIPALHIDENTSSEDRLKATQSLANGTAKVVCNYDLWVEGIDIPCVSCIDIVRPTKKLRVALQMYGRGMRPDKASGKKDLIVIDHAGVVLLHCQPGADIPWTLDSGNKTIEELAKDPQVTGRPPAADVVCKKCKSVFSAAPACPFCGHKSPSYRQAKAVGGRQGTLKLVTSDGSPVSSATLGQYNRVWHASIGAAIKRGLKAGVAVAIFANNTSRKPWDVGVTPMPEQIDWSRPAAEVFPGFVRRSGGSS